MKRQTWTDGTGNAVHLEDRPERASRREIRLWRKSDPITGTDAGALEFRFLRGNAIGDLVVRVRFATVDVGDRVPTLLGRCGERIVQGTHR